MRLGPVGSISNVRTSDNAPITRITASDKELFSWLTSTIKRTYKVRVYVEMTDERLLLVSDLPVAFLEYLKLNGFTVGVEPTPNPMKLFVPILVLFVSIFIFVAWEVFR